MCKQLMILVLITNVCLAESFPIDIDQKMYEKFKEGFVLPISLGVVRNYKSVSALSEDSDVYLTQVEQGVALSQIKNATQLDCINQQKKALKLAEESLSLSKEYLYKNKYHLSDIRLELKDYTQSVGENLKPVIVEEKLPRSYSEQVNGQEIWHYDGKTVTLHFGLKLAKDGAIQCQIVSKDSLKEFLTNKLNVDPKIGRTLVPISSPNGVKKAD